MLGLPDVHPTEILSITTSLQRILFLVSIVFVYLYEE